MYKIFILAIALYSSLAHSMDVGRSKFGDTYYLNLIGVIEKNDFKKIQEMISENGYPRGVNIRSPGGDVEESIKIGRFFNKAFISVSALHTCNSACFFIWAGAYERLTYVSLGLHRPYFDKSYFAGLTASQAKVKYTALTESVRNYLLEMDVPVSFIDTMMSADSENIWYVHEEQLLGKISKYAHAQREWVLSKCSALTSDEKRDHDALTSYILFQSISESKGHENTDLLPYLLEEAEYGKSLRPGYVSYLQNSSREFYQCEEKAIKQARKGIAI